MGECTRFLKDIPGLMRLSIYVGGILFAGGMVWATLGADIKTNTDRSTKNKQAINDIQSNLRTLESNQRVIQNQLQNDQNSNAAFQMRTESNLSRILEKLDDMQKSRWSDPR